MKSLVLTSLLAGSLLFMSGCLEDDDVKDALGLKENVVWMVNGYAEEAITGTVGDDDKLLGPGSLDVFPNTESSLNVSYSKVSSGTLGAVSLATDKVHAYVATDCSGSEGYLTHPLDAANMVQVTNLGATAITNGEYTLSIDGTEVLGASDSAAPCATTALPVTNTAGNIVVTRLSDSQTYEYNLTKSVGFDVVVLTDGSVVILPLFGFNDIPSI